jgi:hypothetical protein
VNHKGFLKIGIIILVVALVGAVAYISWPKTTVAPTPAETSLGNPEILALQTFQGTAKAWFEGWNIATYEFSYPRDAFSVESKSDDNPVVIRTLLTNTTSTITYSYEGARGFSPDDYWNNVLAKQCPECGSVTRHIGSFDARVYALAGISIWTIIEKKPFLFIVHEPSGSAVNFLSTFRVIDIKTQQPGPPPQ